MPGGEIGQGGSPGCVKGGPLIGGAEDLGARYAGELLAGLVPVNHPVFRIDGEHGHGTVLNHVPEELDLYEGSFVAVGGIRLIGHGTGDIVEEVAV